MRRGDGEWRWILARGKAVFDPEGRPLRMLGTHTDVTASQRLQEQLRDSEARLLEAQAVAHIGSWSVDAGTRRIDWSEEAGRIFGVSFRHARMGLVLRLLPAPARSVMRAALGLGLARGEGTQFDLPLAFRDRRPLWVRVTLRAKMAAEKVVRVYGTVQDITALHEAEERQHEAARRLEETAQRAHQLARDAAAATVAKSEFLANMSHEIRTPLNAIIGMGGLMLGTELSDQQREFAETIRLSGDALLSLINDILDFSKIESGSLELEAVPFGLHDCVESALDVLGPRAGEKRLDLLYWIDAAVPGLLVGDVTRLRQILVNLVGNAVKFTSAGEIHVGVEPCAREADGRIRLRFTVRDTGIGIPPERMDRLFKSFSQVDASTTRKFGGTGLGLAISTARCSPAQRVRNACAVSSPSISGICTSRKTTS